MHWDDKSPRGCGAVLRVPHEKKTEKKNPKQQISDSLKQTAKLPWSHMQSCEWWSANSSSFFTVLPYRGLFSPPSNGIKLWGMLKIFCHKICPTPWRTGSRKNPSVVKLRNSVSSHAEQQWEQACTSPTFHLGLIFGNNLFVLLDFRLRWHVRTGEESSSGNPRPGVTVSAAAALLSPAFFAVLSR